MSIATDILAGVHDADLDTIYDVTERRRKAVAQMNAYSLRAGDRVSLTGLRPASMNGLTGVVEGMKRTTVSVKLDQTPLGRFGSTVRVPAVCVRRV